MLNDVWLVDSRHSEISFTLRHLVLAQLSGHVLRWQATLKIDPDSPELSSVEAVLDARSIETDEVERDAHIRSPEFLDVEVFPQIVFRSHRVTCVETDQYRVDGYLTLRNVTHEVTLNVRNLGRQMGENGGTIASFGAHAQINRQDFGLHWNQDLATGGIVLGDKVDIQILVEAAAAREAAAIAPRGQ